MVTIYRILNKENGREYIGSTQNYPKRITKHKYMLKCGDHRNRFLQDDYNEIGPEGFIFEAIEHFVDTSSQFEREQYWMDAVKKRDKDALYNILPFAGRALGRVHFESTKLKMSVAAKGRRPSEATLRGAEEYRKTHTVSAETRAKMGATLRLVAKRGEQACNAKLSEAEVIEMLRRLKQGELQRDVAPEYGIAKSTLSHIWLGTTWAHIDRDAI